MNRARAVKALSDLLDAIEDPSVDERPRRSRGARRPVRPAGEVDEVTVRRVQVDMRAKGYRDGY